MVIVSIDSEEALEKVYNSDADTDVVGTLALEAGNFTVRCGGSRDDLR